MTAQSRIALFIDFENLVTNTGVSASNFDLSGPLDRLLERGKVIFRRAYCDWSRFGEAKARLHDFGVELVEVPPSTRAGKNSADMRLVIDALELCYAREHIDTYVIASGDSDFVPLAAKLRENDRFVIGIAVKGSTSPMFVKACDEFIYLSTSTSAERAHRERPSNTRSDAPRADRAPKTVPARVREVVAGLFSRAAGPVNPSLIKDTLVRRQPDFDVKDLGYANFSRLLDAMEKEGIIKRITQGKQTYVVAPDSAAETNVVENAGPDASPPDATRAEDEVLEEIPDPD